LLYEVGRILTLAIGIVKFANATEVEKGVRLTYLKGRKNKNQNGLQDGGSASVVKTGPGQCAESQTSFLTSKARRGFAQKVLVQSTSQDSELNSTPQEFANFSPGFLPWGTSRLTSSFTLKELRNRMELFQSYEINDGGLTQGS
jgi:hypothetical protein